MPMRPALLAAISAQQFSPSGLFSAGEVGAWYDPSDFTTMFQDNLGTTPVTATGQPVGLILDKSKGAAPGPELVSNGTFTTNTTGWTAGFGATTSTFAASSGNAVLTIVSPDTTPRYVTTLSGLTSGAYYKVLFTIVGSIGTGDKIVVWTSNSNGTGGTNIVQGPTPTNKAYTFYVAATAATMYLAFGFGTSAVGDTFTIDNVSVVSIPGNHASQATSTSRPVLQREATDQYYLAFDGTDDSLATASIDFSATNKVSLFAGVRKLSDAAQGVLAELTADITLNSGGFGLYAPDGAATNFNFASKGTTKIDNIITPYTAPTTAVITGLADIGAPSNTIRVNGSQIGSVVTTSQGTGNYSNAVLNIGRRGGATLPVNARLYSLIIRGAATTPDQISRTETWVNSKTGAF